MSYFLSMPNQVYQDLRTHLTDGKEEDSAFIYTKVNMYGDKCQLEFIDWDPITDKDYQSRSAFHLWLSDEMRAHVIKRAHDLDAALVEFHSHPGDEPARFSSSDFSGFSEFVPHVLWRLPERPYSAVVFTDTNFDGLVWLTDEEHPIQLSGISVEEQILEPTTLSLKDYYNYDYPRLQ
jgi:proteasome lid subunit RPN8/RPN11